MSEEEKETSEEESEASEVDDLLGDMISNVEKEMSGEEEGEEDEEDKDEEPGDEGDTEEEEGKESEEDNEETDETPEDETELETLKKQVTVLNEQLEAMAGKFQDKENKEVQIPSTERDYFQDDTDDDIENVFGVADSQGVKDKLNAFARSVADQTKQDMMKAIPQLVTGYVTNQMQMQRRIDGFYTDNEDLIDSKQFVGNIATEIQSANPDWNTEQILKETAIKVRKALNIKKKSGKKKNLPSSKGNSRKQTPVKLSDLQQEVNELLDI